MTPALIRQLFCFGLVGAAATATHYLTALLGHEWLGINLYLANLLGYVTALSVSFVGHGWLTFQVSLTRARLARFVPASVSVFLASELLLWGLESATPLPHQATLLLVVATVPVATFLINRYWVYR